MTKDQLIIEQMNTISDIVKVLVVAWLICVLIRQAKDIRELEK